MTDTAELGVSRCPSCQASFLPRPGPCPRCGALAATPHHLPALAVVLAGVESLSPPSGFSAPHRLALVEAAESVRLLVTVEGDLPPVGAQVRVRQDGERYFARSVE